MRNSKISPFAFESLKNLLTFAERFDWKPEQARQSENSKTFLP
jgi:hypothetical protein